MSGGRFLRKREQICFVSSLGDEGGALVVLAEVLLVTSSFDLDLDDSIADKSAIGNTRALISRFVLMFVYRFRGCG